MKMLIPFIMICAALPGAEAPTTEAARLLEALPAQRQLHEAQEIVVERLGGVPTPTAEGLADRRRIAEEAVAKAKEIIPKLRPLIRVGSSVLDYPGLLGRGNISWSPLAKEYELYIGVYLRGEEGREPFDFRIRFDAKGIVTAVEDVIWKH